MILKIIFLLSWIPMKERSILGAFVFGGGQVGTIIGTMVSGFILDSYQYPVVFYFFGVMGIVWFIFFVRAHLLFINLKHRL
jgi:MFS transporter, ACS family, solute carrier family 17 (sodium-dependent inorganic phosphate cotransporter), other